MTLLDAAIQAFLAPSNGHADPLTTALQDQCTQPGALDDTHAAPGPKLRAGWENEPIDVPPNWPFLAACVLCSLFAFVLAGCA